MPDPFVPSGDGAAIDAGDAREVAQEKIAKAKKLYLPVAPSLPVAEWRPDHHPEWGTVGEVAAYGKWSVAYVRGLIAKGKIEAVQEGDKYKIKVDSAVAHIAGLPSGRRSYASSPEPAAPRRGPGRPRKIAKAPEPVPDSVDEQTSVSFDGQG
jgi:excisionase family DNA binding protein